MVSTYKYEAISLAGAEVKGVIKAHDQAEAVIALRDSMSSVISVKEVKEKQGFLESLTTPKLNEKELAMVCRQFSIILKAGLPIVKSVELVRAQTDDPFMKKLLGEVVEDVMGGYSLANSFMLHGATLPTTFIETIRSGEESGSLPSSFEKLYAFFTKRVNNRSKVKSALIYPIFVIVIAVIVVAVVMVVAVPKFTSIFAEQGADMPLMTRMLIGMSNFFVHWIWLIVLIIVALIVAYQIYARSDQGRMKVARWKLRLPVLGRIALMNDAAQFANTFSMLLAAGIPVTRALGVTAKTMDNEAIGESVSRAVEGVESGYTVTNCLRREAILPELLVEMCGVGEESGSIEETLGTIAEYFDNEVEVATKRAIAMLEPAITIFLGIFVGFLVLAMYLPMFSMYNGM